jgi:hypothetical protein
MKQEIIVYIILAIAVGLIIYLSLRKKLVKKAPVSKSNCEDSGCSGCALKEHCH